MTVDWPVVELGTHLRVKHGFAFKGAYFGESGDFIVLTPGNFYDEGGFKPKDGSEKFYAAQPPAEYVLKRNDLVVAMTEQVQGLLGSSALIPCDGTYLHNQRIGLVELVGDVDRRFIYYLFNTPLVRDQIQATATGSKVRHTAPSRIEAVKVRLPPITTQRKIGAILSQYDDLIENNHRRIKLLEQMVQRIYREWFVAFRYPGSEDVALVDSELGLIPQGWRVSSLGEVVDVNARTAKTLDSYECIEYIDISAVECGSIRERKVLASLEAPGRARRLVADGDVIWSTVRPNLRAYALILEPSSSCVVSTGFAVLTPSEVPTSFLYAMSSDDWFVEYLTNHATGAAYPAVTGRVFEQIPLTVPPGELLEKFDSLAGPALRLTGRLHAVIENLRAARDLLLPRLISGEINVEDLDISMEEAAA